MLGVIKGIFIFISLGFSFVASAAPSEHTETILPECRQHLAFDFELHYGSAVTPIGMSTGHFETLLSLIDHAPELSDVEAVVFFGSRTHFSWGYQPTPTSDLDVLFFYRHRLSGNALLEKYTDENILLKAFSSVVGFEVDSPFTSPGLLSEDLQTTTDTFLNNHVTPVEESHLCEDCEKQSKLEGWTRNQIKEKMHDGINKEAIIALKLPVEAGTVERLREAGYKNIVILR